MAHRFRVWSVLAAVACCLLATAPAGAQPAAGDGSPTSSPWNVVILNDADPTLPAFVAIDRGIRAVLSAPGRHPVNVFPETLDLFRFRKSQIEAETVALLEHKFAGTQLHAVIALGAGSLGFAEAHRARLWPDARIVFSGVPVEWLRGRTLSPMTVGFPLQHDLTGTAELALRLQTGLRRLIVIAGSGEYDRIMTAVARSQLDAHYKTLAIEYWLDRPIADFLSGVAGLRSTDAVLYLSIARDSEGRTFVPRDVMHQLAEVSPVPIYGPAETYLGAGATAGRVYSLQERGRRTGELVQTLLSDPATPASALRPLTSTCVADARQLERFGMAGRLPGDCEVRFAPPSLWRDYPWHVLAALAIVLAQSALIFALVLQRRMRRRAEEEIQRRRMELGQASRLAVAGELTATIAHEINQPLGAILANAGAAESLLRRGTPAADEMREIIGAIKQADLRASEIIQRVRALVSAQPTERRFVEVNEVVAETLTLIKGEASRRRIVIDTALGPGLPPVMADRIQLHQALVNLCVNAMDAMNDTHVDHRRIEVATTAVDGGVEVTVSDSGSGIAPEHLRRLFDSFFTTKAQGTGLGLSIVRSIVEAHGGTLSAENRATGGATFRIVLPVHVAGEARSKDAVAGARATSPGGAPLPERTLPDAS